MEKLHTVSKMEISLDETANLYITFGKQFGHTYYV